jgi:hypothetical protein
MRGTGLDRHTKEPVGYHHTTTGNGTLWVTGMAIMADVNMTTAGITTGTVATMTATTKKTTTASRITLRG